MFRGRSAWFSQSVSPGPRELWAAGGGALAHQQDADYLFSSDADHPDTRRLLTGGASSQDRNGTLLVQSDRKLWKIRWFCQKYHSRIHQSLDYLEGRATVFHSRYLSAWASSGAAAKPSVVLGHFVLPPARLQEEIRRQIGGFIWEQADDSLAEQPNENLTDDEPEVARKGCEEEAEEDVIDLAESSEEETGSRGPAQGEFPYRALQEYPLNNMVTGYTSACDMKKYTGELRDFTPGTSGYTVYWIQNEINIHSDAKTRAKRKL